MPMASASKGKVGRWDGRIEGVYMRARVHVAYIRISLSHCTKLIIKKENQINNMGQTVGRKRDAGNRLLHALQPRCADQSSASCWWQWGRGKHRTAARTGTPRTHEQVLGSRRRFWIHDLMHCRLFNIVDAITSEEFGNLSGKSGSQTLDHWRIGGSTGGLLQVASPSKSFGLPWRSSNPPKVQ